MILVSIQFMAYIRKKVSSLQILNIYYVSIRWKPVSTQIRAQL